MKLHTSAYLAIVSLIATTYLAATPITLVNLGTSAPPATIGGYAINALAPDLTPSGTAVTSVGSGAETVSFDNEVTHYTIGSGWSSWSHGYTGSVYGFDQLLFGDSLTLSLPAATRAFQFYLQPDFFDFQSLGITATSGGTLYDFGSFDIDGTGGALGLGFYAGLGDPSLSSITITGLSTFPDGFAVGEFGIRIASTPHAVPDGGATVLLIAGALLGLTTATHRTLRRRFWRL